jgi:hypothetical protein
MMEILLVVVLLLAFLGWFGNAPMDYTSTGGVIHLVLVVLVVLMIVYVLRSTWQ